MSSLNDLRIELDALTRNVALCTVDKHIANADSTQVHLRSLRNNYTAIAILPPELLAIILTAVIQPAEDSEYEVVPWRERVALSSICRTWRAVALDTAAFWANFGVSTSPYFPEMVARSKETPLKVRLGGIDPTVERNFDSEAKDLSDALRLLVKPTRLEEFHVQGHKEQEVTFYARHFPHDPTPLLQSLIIQVPGPEHKVDIPRHILSFRKPLLHSLTLDSCRVPWADVPRGNGLDDPVFSNLSYLRLVHTEPRPPSGLFLDILRASPNLVELELNDSIPGDLSPLSDKSRKPIPFDCLDLYMVTDTTIHSSILYTHITHPLTTAPLIYLPHFALPIESLNEDQERQMIHAFLGVHGLTERGARRVLPEPGLVLCLRASRGILTMVVLGANMTYQLTCTQANYPFVLRTLRVPDYLEHLVFETDNARGSPTTEDWVHFLEVHKDIKELTFEEGCLDRSILFALTIAQQENPSNLRLLLPHLNLLVIQRLAISEQMFENLLDMLKSRRAHGAPLRTLKIDCLLPLSYAMVGKLREAVEPGVVSIRCHDDLDLGMRPHEIEALKDAGVIDH